MVTIYCTSKLEKFLKPLINKEDSMPVEDQWNANLFYYHGKKCLAFIHKETLYVVVIFEITKSDLKNINSLFTEAFIEQLYSDRILTKEQEPHIRIQLIEISFRQTNNDKSALGSLNDVIYRLTYWSTIDKDFEKVKNYVRYHINEVPWSSFKYKCSKYLMQESDLYFRKL